MSLPTVTADQYRAAISKFTAEEQTKPNPDQEYLALLAERAGYADGLVYISSVEGQGYILAYENRYIFKIVTGGFMFMLHMAQSPIQKQEVTIDYLLRKSHWFNEFAILPHIQSSYDTLAAGIAVPGTNPHVDFFRIRFDVKLAKFFDVNEYLPEDMSYEYNNNFIVCYGTAKESPDFNYQFEIYLSSLLELLTPNITDERLVRVFCNILTNEVGVINGQLRLDVALIDKVRALMGRNPQIVNEQVNLHLDRIKKMPEHGLEMAGCTLSMLRQILPTLSITTLTQVEESQFSGFVSRSDRRAIQ